MNSRMLAPASSFPRQCMNCSTHHSTTTLLSQVTGLLMRSAARSKHQPAMLSRPSSKCHPIQLAALRHQPVQQLKLLEQRHIWTLRQQEQQARRPNAPAAANCDTEHAVIPHYARGTVVKAHSLATSEAAVGAEPIIVAASWLGAKKRPFSKYKELWQSMGFSKVLAARPPMTSIMVPVAGQLLAADFTRRLLQAARQHPDAPILVHLFSGGGFIFMGWVFQLLAELQSQEAQSVRERIRGVILDSSPAEVTADVSSRALIAAALGQPAEGIEQRYPWLVKPLVAAVDSYLKLPFIKDSLVVMEKSWMHHAPCCPKLFLFSDADVLIQPQVVEAFMQQQQAQGSVVYSYRWADSGHVDHYRKYPEEYKQQLLKFVLQTLGPSSHDTVAEAAAVVERQAQQ